MGRKKAPDVPEENRLPVGTVSDTLANSIESQIQANLRAAASNDPLVNDRITELDVTPPTDTPPNAADHPDFLPGMAPERIDELDVKGAQYHAAKMKRCEQSKVERETKDALITAMQTHKKTFYRTIDNIVVNCTPGYKIKTEQVTQAGVSVAYGDGEEPDDEAIDE